MLEYLLCLNKGELAEVTAACGAPRTLEIWLQFLVNTPERSIDDGAARATFALRVLEVLLVASDNMAWLQAASQLLNSVLMCFQRAGHDIQGRVADLGSEQDISARSMAATSEGLRSVMMDNLGAHDIELLVRAISTIRHRIEVGVMSVVEYHTQRLSQIARTPFQVTRPCFKESRKDTG